MKTKTVASLLLIVMGIFQLVAAFACFIPSFVHDRVSAQFMPVWAFLTKPFYSGEPDQTVIHGLAVASQWIIGISEGVIGFALLGAGFISSRRLALANFGIACAACLYGVFLVTMFAMHDKSLPAWKQYPPILAWIGVTWVAVLLSEKDEPSPKRS